MIRQNTRVYYSTTQNNKRRALENWFKKAAHNKSPEVLNPAMAWTDKKKKAMEEWIDLSQEEDKGNMKIPDIGANWRHSYDEDRADR